MQGQLVGHFGLRENPFGVTPDPRFLFLSQTHREALASLVNGIDCDFGFQILVAQPGMGKTTLLFNFLERFRGDGPYRFSVSTAAQSSRTVPVRSDRVGNTLRGNFSSQIVGATQPGAHPIGRRTQACNRRARRSAKSGFFGSRSVAATLEFRNCVIQADADYSGRATAAGETVGVARTRTVDAADFGVRPA